MELIPGLIDEMARECLIRVPFDGFPTISSVCKAWSLEILQPDFHRQRKSSDLSRPVIVLAQAVTQPGGGQQNPGSDNPKSPAPLPTYWLTAFEPESGSWTRLPPAPGLSNGLPVFAGLVGCGSDLLVIGGWDPVTWQVSRAVYIFNFLTGRWRRGADLPGSDRSLFGCAADSGRRVVVLAGGHDEEKRALRSAMAYDLASDRWMSLADMSTERDECTVIFHAGRFLVISGYRTERQGSFEKSAESLDPDTWLWGPVEEDFLESDGGVRCCVVGVDGQAYTCQSGSVEVRRGDRWQGVTEVTGEVSWVQHVSVWNGKVMVIGSRGIGGIQMGAYLYDSGRCRWNKVNMPGEYNGHVQAGCILEL